MTPAPSEWPAHDSGAAAGRPRVVLTIGKLDGVHAGHRHLLAHVIAEADRRGVAAAAVVLHPDPATVLSGRRVPLLTTVPERQRRLQAFGVRHVWPIPFDRALADLTPEAFVDRLSGPFELAAVVISPDFAFGRGRSGTPEALAELGTARGFDVVVAQPLVVAGEKVGSRAIRARIATGDIAGAATLLRQPPQLEGLVVPGAARGRELGFATANLLLSADFELPADGVYTVSAAWRWPDPVRPAGQALGLASIGLRPTFGPGERLVEVHLLDFAGDLYGAEMTVDFLLHQRGEARFETPAALIQQMQADEAAARAYVARLAGPHWRAHREVDLPGVVVHAQGPDLAAACNHLASAWRAGGAPPQSPAAQRRHNVALAAATDAELCKAWLTYLATHGPATADVYQAGDGWLHALVRAPLSAAPSGGRPQTTVQLGRDSDGWLAVDATVSPVPG
jgi:riboflavin kinase / FMN adenylyltransferase